jgi:hypothetical protein
MVSYFGLNTQIVENSRWLGVVFQNGGMRKILPLQENVIWGEYYHPKKRLGW